MRQRPDDPGVACKLSLGIKPAASQPVERAPPPEEARGQFDAPHPMIPAQEMRQLVGKNAPPAIGRDRLQQVSGQQQFGAAQAPEHRS